VLFWGKKHGKFFPGKRTISKIFSGWKKKIYEKNKEKGDFFPHFDVLFHFIILFRIYYAFNNLLH
jgi:hypothetical protein